MAIQLSTELGACLSYSCPDWDGVEADMQSVGYRIQQCSKVVGCMLTAKAAEREEA